MSFLVRVPFAAHVLPLSGVSDPVFASGVAGDGRALLPEADCTYVAVHSPISGVITKLKSHVAIITSTRGPSILTHPGIDIIGLRGRGFAPLVEEGDVVDVGAPLIHWDLGPARTASLSPCVPVVAISPSGRPVSPKFGETLPTAEILDPLFSPSDGDWAPTVCTNPTALSGRGVHLLSVSESVSGWSRAAARTRESGAHPWGGPQL